MTAKICAYDGGNLLEPVFVPAAVDHTEDGRILLWIGHEGAIVTVRWARLFAAQILDETLVAEKRAAQGIVTRKGGAAPAAPGAKRVEPGRSESDAPR